MARSKSISDTLLYKVEGLKRSLILGEQFEKALEMLPSDQTLGLLSRDPDDRVSGSEGSSDPSIKDGALTGSLWGNCPSSFRYDGAFDGGSIVNYYGSWKDRSIFDLFDTWRSGAKIREDENCDYFVTYQGVRFQFLSHGTHGKRGVSFKYMLRFHGFTVLIFGKPDAGDMPSVQIDFSYESLRGRSIFDARLEVENFLLALGFRWESISFQRIDLNVTLNTPFSEVTSAFCDGRVVSRVRRFHFEYANSSGGLICNYVSGGDSINITLYDKMHELITRYNEDKYDDLEHVIGDGVDLTRVEFRLSSEYLGSLDIHTWEDLEDMVPAIVEYLTGDWFRILENKKIRGKENKQVISDFWLRVREAFFQIFIKSSDIKPLKKKKKYCFSRSRLIRQALGCFNKALALSYNHAGALESYLNDVNYLIKHYKGLAFKQYRLKCEEVDVLFRKIRPDLSTRSSKLGRRSFVCLS